ncbi:MAG TPA: hypothetical protein VFD43_07510 [Planctomycetota bacterium]|nr:hypothetical protein [Planctomycetota bacterium]
MADMNAPRCAKCGRGMERGLIIDRTEPMIHASASTWMEGAPEPSFWAGLKTKGKEQHPVISFRCPGCGYLESYAPASPGSPA